MSAFTQIDLSTLPAPDVIEELNFETIFAAMLADLQARDPVFNALLESDPAYKILEVAAYRELLLRQRVNDAARAVMLAYATGADLDQLGALLGVLRLVIDEGDAEAVPPVPQVLESDTEFRRRIQLSLEGFSVAGPRGAYIFHGLSADANVLDISATSPTPGNVLITVLSRIGNGVASAPLLASVNAALNSDSIRPLTDQVTVQSASIVNFTVAAGLYVYPGPDSSVVLTKALAALNAYISQVHKIGQDVTLSGIYAALHQPGVQRVNLTQPTANVVISATQASFCTSINVTVAGTDE
jgi:phage-related baseplate assembly protein